MTENEIVKNQTHPKSYSQNLWGAVQKDTLQSHN